MSRHSAVCPACGMPGSMTLVEEFRGGRFMECSSCSVHFTLTSVTDPKQFYDTIWSHDQRDCQPYLNKRAAIKDSDCLRVLLDTTPRFRWALTQLATMRQGSRVLDIGCGEGALLWGARSLGHEVAGCDLATTLS
jgi:SAM-dependent methyltransferase